MPVDSQETTAVPMLAGLPWLLQVADSQFPSGSYAHSMGLEELAQCGVVQKADDVEHYIHHQVIPALCAFDLPYLAEAHRVAAGEDLEGLRRLDDELEAWKIPQELRQASRQIGSRRLALVRKLQPSTFVEAYAQSASPFHQIAVCAVELRALAVATALCVFGFQTIAGQASAAMKLVRMGQERSQTMVRGAMIALAPKLEAIAGAKPATPGWFNPLVEIASMRHAGARERLFIS